MRKILKFCIIVIFILGGYFWLTDKHLSKRVVERRIEANKNQAIGDTIKCPNCRKTFEKTAFHQVFCSTDCKENYERVAGKIIELDEKIVGTTNEIAGKAVETIKNIKKQ